MWSPETERLQQLLLAGPPTTPEGVEELDRAFEAHDRVLSQQLADYLADRRQQLEADVAPDLVARLGTGRDAVEAGLAHADAAIRRLALFLAYHGHRDLLTAPVLCAIISDDPDEELRRSALSHLGWSHHRCKIPSLGAFLAEIVSAPHEPARVRGAAYRGLLLVEGLTDLWHAQVATFRFPEDVDWSLVARFLPARPERSAS